MKINNEFCMSFSEKTYISLNSSFEKNKEKLTLKELKIIKMQSEEINETIFGIDLGTSTCLCGRMNETRGLDLVDFGSTQLMPSSVCYTENKTLVGNEINNKPNGVISESKILLSKKYSDEYVQNQINTNSLSYELVKGKQGEVMIKTSYSCKSGNNKEVREKIVHPYEVSSELLKHIKKCTCNKYNLDVNKVVKAVITVPAYFNNKQRAETIKAAQLAGIVLL